MERTFTAAGPTRTRFDYTVRVGVGVVRNVTPLPAPAVLAGSIYQIRMGRYQWGLKALIEGRR